MPINQPGGPFVPRPDLGPGVGFGPGLPPPTRQPGSLPSFVTPPPEGSINTQVLTPITNPATGETYTAPTGGYTLNPNQQPGGPFVPRPDLGPGVGFGPGLPSPQPGMPGGKSNPIGNFIGSTASLIPNAIGDAAAQSQDPQAQQIAPLFTGLGGVLNQTFGGMTSPGGKSQPGGPYVPRPDLGPNIGFGVGLPSTNSNFGSTVGTQSPMLNSINTGFNPNAGNTTLPGNF